MDRKPTISFSVARPNTKNDQALRTERPQCQIAYAIVNGDNSSLYVSMVRLIFPLKRFGLMSRTKKHPMNCGRDTNPPLDMKDFELCE